MRLNEARTFKRPCWFVEEHARLHRVARMDGRWIEPADRNGRALRARTQHVDVGTFVHGLAYPYGLLTLFGVRLKDD